MEKEIRFGTDGWRAIIGEDFTDENLVRVVEAAAKIFQEDFGGTINPTLIIGYDCRVDARRYAELAASVAAACGFKVELSRDYCPTPALCWSIAQNDAAVGGIMLTSSHNPAEYHGVKLRMPDGGASSQEFTDRVEAALAQSPTDKRGNFSDVDLVSPYLDALKGIVDTGAIRAAKLRIVVDPLFGAGRIYLARLLEELGVEVVEINNAADPSFEGLHPEPIPPWTDRAAAKVKELGFDAAFITDGDADRIGAIDEDGSFVNPHRIMTMLVSHLVEDKGLCGRVVSTVTASALLVRECNRLGLELDLMPVGFKWIYSEMGKGGVLIGGEESGGIGIPTHIKERDGLLMALLLAETMAHRQKSLKALVEELFEKLGQMEFSRRGLFISAAQMERFRSETVPDYTPEGFYGRALAEIDRRDGIKLCFADDSWVMMRPSGTEPLVRIYAEAPTMAEVEELLAAAESVVTA
ncbi:MAG: phosphoglucosamine mutase [Eggerthellaceae bacterium]|nr:phosphoglucosamine mutase [Eggerthellaceae bacterium]